MLTSNRALMYSSGLNKFEIAEDADILWQHFASEVYTFVNDHVDEITTGIEKLKTIVNDPNDFSDEIFDPYYVLFEGDDGAIKFDKYHSRLEVETTVELDVLDEYFRSKLKRGLFLSASLYRQAANEIPLDLYNKERNDYIFSTNLRFEKFFLKNGKPTLLFIEGY